MDFLGIGFWELAFVFIIAMMVFGPRRMPEIAAKAGKYVRDIRGMSQGLMAEWQREITVATRLDELQEARKELESIKQEFTNTQQQIGNAQKSLTDQVQQDFKEIQNTIAPPVEQKTTVTDNQLNDTPASPQDNDTPLSPPSKKTKEDNSSSSINQSSNESSASTNSDTPVVTPSSKEALNG